MYFVVLIGANYSIAIKTAIIGTIGETVRFRSFLQNCSATALYPVNCDIDITYDWQDDTPGSGTSTITLLSGSSQVTDTPSGYSLTGIQITNITGSACNYSNYIDCTGDPFTTTTTTTTTTSTTTTTTTIADTGNTLLLKFDPYSSSYNASVGTLTNLGTISSYNLQSNNISGVGYVQITGSGTSQALVLNEYVSNQHQVLDDNGELASLINLHNKSWYLGMMIYINRWVDSYPYPTSSDKEGPIFEMLGRKTNSSGKLNGLRFVSHAYPTSSATGTVIAYALRDSRKILEVQNGGLNLRTWYWVEYNVTRDASGIGQRGYELITYDASGNRITSNSAVQNGVSNTSGEMDYQVADQIGQYSPTVAEFSSFHIGALVFATASSGAVFSQAQRGAIRTEYQSRF